MCIRCRRSNEGGLIHKNDSQDHIIWESLGMKASGSPNNAIYTNAQRCYFSLLSHTGYSRLSVVFVFL